MLAICKLGHADALEIVHAVRMKSNSFVHTERVSHFVHTEGVLERARLQSFSCVKQFFEGIEFVYKLRPWKWCICHDEELFRTYNEGVHTRIADFLM